MCGELSLQVSSLKQFFNCSISYHFSPKKSKDTDADADDDDDVVEVDATENDNKENVEDDDDEVQEVSEWNRRDFNF